MPQLLVITHHAALRAELRGILQDGGYRVTGDTPRTASQSRHLTSFDAVLADIDATDREGLLRHQPARPVIVVAAQPDVRQAVQAIKQGAWDYLPLPLRAEELLGAVQAALAAGPPPMDGEHPFPFALTGTSGAMAEVRKLAVEAAPADSAVLIEGESGTGKAALAHAIHAASRRNQTPLITVNCAAIPETMMETELFGHVASDNGLVEAALGGTLFLQEVCNLMPDIQARLLSLLRGGRAAGNARTSNFRIIASSHVKVAASVERGQFLRDLADCLSDVVISLPPLRSRGDDAVELAEDWVAQISRKLGKAPVQFSSDASRKIRNYRWPGNVRELANAIERAVLLCNDSVVPAELLAIDHGLSSPATARMEPPQDDGDEPVSLAAYFASFVQQHQEHLTETELAKKLGISRKSLWERRQRLNIPRTKTHKRGPRRP